MGWHTHKLYETYHEHGERELVQYLKCEGCNYETTIRRSPPPPPGPSRLSDYEAALPKRVHL